MESITILFTATWCEILHGDDKIPAISKYSRVHVRVIPSVFSVVKPAIALTVSHRLLCIMFSRVRKLHLSYSNPNGKYDERGSSFDKALGSECVVIHNVETATTKSTPVEECEPPRKPMKCSTLPWSNALLCVIIFGVALLLLSPIIVFYLPRDLLGLDEVRL